ncbi:helix-turn-helix domain-containing protein [Citrobacter enshiensis]|uniref:helix-turn-helix domain-containing protein n=1 Tax=Citrobacter enshiensis TaxID=2971264 RepID=UPI00399D77BA
MRLGINLPLATSKGLFIHRNTLGYRLNRISELNRLDLGNFDDRLLLYVHCNWMNNGRRDLFCRPDKRSAISKIKRVRLRRTRPVNVSTRCYLRVSFSRSASISLILLVTTDSR